MQCFSRGFFSERSLAAIHVADFTEGAADVGGLMLRRQPAASQEFFFGSKMLREARCSCRLRHAVIDILNSKWRAACAEIRR